MRVDLCPARIDSRAVACYPAEILFRVARIDSRSDVGARAVPERINALLKRLALMSTVVSIAILATACGRATDEQINQALGITPTATMSAEQITESTAAASATSAARELALASPGAVQGDITAGSRQFNTWCIGCHGPGGAGPDILSPGSPGSSVSPDALLALIRDGEGHTPPGPYKPTEISDKQVTDIAAYLQSAPGK